MSSEPTSWIVMKFGGTSVSTPEHWQTIADAIRSSADEGLRPLVVCSAVAGVSRALHRMIDGAPRGESDPALAEVRQVHLDLARQLGVDGEELLSPYLDELARLALGTSLTGELTPHLRARALATGELMSTTLGAAWLEGQGIRIAWRDARRMLVSVERPRMLPVQRYLSAVCRHDPDPELQAELAGLDADAVLTQGFIAGNPAGETVLVSWGGSDTSAAYFAGKLEARRLEIWTDVPGMFTADPRQIPSARMLRHLDYDEAQELASTGAEVLHPRCVDPLRRRGIPLRIRCTQAPEMEGTVIGGEVPDSGPRVKAISARRGVSLVSMDTPGMWHEVGFLARAFGVFERHGLSVDLVATSETNVTVSIDRIEEMLDVTGIEGLTAELGEFCTVRQIGPCAAVSLVGRTMRSILHEIGPALRVLDEQTVHMVTQSSSDLNLTFVVDEQHADRLVDRLHAELFDVPGPDGLFGPTWQELFEGQAVADRDAGVWWRSRRRELLELAAERSPVYVYDPGTLQAAIDRLQAMTAVDRVLYAIKANSFPDLLRVVLEAGLDVECVSPGEIALIRDLFPEIEPGRILFTPNFAPRHEYAAALEAGIQVTIDNLHPLAEWPELFRDRELIVRVDPGRGHGHHEHVRTAGAQSKFGVAPDDLDRLEELATRAGARIVGLHAHVGSGIHAPETWPDMALFLASLAGRFDDVRLLDLGGGLGVAERPGDSPLDLDAIDARLADVRRAHPGLDLWLEPGRYVVAEAGVLLARVTQVKAKGDVHYVGVETGMNSLLRPALYGSYHEIVNLTRLDEPPAITAEVVGPICETGDVLGRGRRLPATREGDVLLVATAGAYGRAMSSNYNRREPAGEVMLGVL